MTLITYHGRPVAMAGSHRLYLAPHVDRLANGDSLKRFVCLLALYARDVQNGDLPGEPVRYLPRRGERYARQALMPTNDFAAVRHSTDYELAKQFGVPIDEVARRRRELDGGQMAARPQRRLRDPEQAVHSWTTETMRAARSTRRDRPHERHERP